MAKVLIFEDSKGCAHVYGTICKLAKVNYFIIDTPTKSSIDQVCDYKPDMIIMDIGLPNISGIELTKQIRQVNALKDIPIIAVSAFAMEADIDAMIKAGAKEYYSKPIEIVKMVEVIKSYVMPSDS